MSLFRVTEAVPQRKPVTAIKTSTFFLTINPNRAYTDPEVAKHAATELRARLNDIFGRFEEFLTPHKDDNGDPGDELRLSMEMLKRLVTDASIETAYEFGKRFHRLHCHSLIKIKHKGVLFKINLTKLRQELPGMRVDAKFVYNPEMTLEKYLLKQQQYR